MNRSTGVTVSVVIAILGSLLSLVFGGLLILTSATTSADQPLPDWQPAPPVQAAMLASPSVGTPAAMSALYFWFGIILGSIATAVPLWLLIRRRKSFLEACRLPVLP